MWEKALTELALDGPASVVKYVDLIGGDTAFVRMKRQAVINAARTPGEDHLARVQQAFPQLDLAVLVEALRVKVAVMRLEGRL